MISYQRFENRLVHSADGIVSPLNEIKDKTILRGLKNCFLGYSSLYRTSSEPSSPESHKPFLQLYYRFIEIHDTYRMLMDIHKYLKELPSRKQFIYTSLQLRFFAQAYVSDAFVLRDRLLKYVAIIRKITDATMDQNIVLKTEPLLRLAKEELFMYSEMRNEHVHDHRQTSREHHLLVALETIAKNTKKEIHWKRYRKEFSIIKRQTLDFFNRTNVRVGSVLDSYFLLLEPLVFDSNGNILLFKMPPKSKK